MTGDSKSELGAPPNIGRLRLRLHQLGQSLSEGASRQTARFDQRELLIIATMVSVITWSLYAFTLATPGLLDRNGNLKGTDFLQFYTLAHVASLGDAELLYDIEGYDRMVRQLVPETPETFYSLYPPQLSVFLQPLSHLSYASAAIVWSLFSIGLYGLACYIVWRQCPTLVGSKALVAILAVGSPAFFLLIGHGQTTGISMLLFAAMLSPLCSGRKFLAGSAFGLLVFKPHFGLAGALVFLINREWRMLLGATCTAAAQLAIGWRWYGSEAFFGYLDLLSRPQTALMMLETDLLQTHSLRTQWTLLLPWRSWAFAAYALSSFLVITLVLKHWRSSSPSRLRYSVLLIATVLVSPHVFVYDLVILMPAFLIILDWSLSHPEHRHSPVLQLLLGAAFLSPFLGPFAGVTRIQISVVVLTAILVVLTQLKTVLSSQRKLV